jgi:hypothetical protein
MKDEIFLMMAVTRTWITDRMRVLRDQRTKDHTAEDGRHSRGRFTLDRLLHPVVVVHHDCDANRDHLNHGG